MSKPVILLAIDGREEREALATQLGAANIACQCVDQPTELVAELGKAQPATVIVDISFGGRSAHHLLRCSALKLNGTPVVFRTRRSARELELALEASLSGAGHFLLTPHDQGQLGQIIDRARCYFDEQRTEATTSCESRMTNSDGAQGSSPRLDELLVGSSRAIGEIRVKAGQVATLRCSLFIQGEVGTGKQWLAKAIHEVSPWRHGPWIAVNTSSIPKCEADRYLFGSRVSERGGDWVVHLGKCDEAVGGTLFLDELGDLEAGAQLSLLRRIERQAEMANGNGSEAKTFRLVAATSRDPEKLVSSGRLREDLYRCLQDVSIILPPLRDRMEDIASLATHFLRQVSQLQGRRVEGFSDRALGELSRFVWPGNLDQLRNVIERLVGSSSGPLIETATIPADLRAVRPDRRVLKAAARPRTLQAFPVTDPERDLTPLQRQERLLIIDALAQTDDNVVDAARLLKMGQATVYRKIRQYHISHTRRRRKRT